VWGTANGDDNIVWGTDCGGGDCDNVVWGTTDGDDNIVWGTADGDDNIVWGTALGDDNIVWGTALGDDNIVWGTAVGDDNIVWGTALNTSVNWTATTLNGLAQISPSSFNQMTDDQIFAAINTLSTQPIITPRLPTLFGTISSIVQAVTTSWSSVLGGGF
jgi:hypothetical protein